MVKQMEDLQELLRMARAYLESVYDMQMEGFEPNDPAVLEMLEQAATTVIELIHGAEDEKDGWTYVPDMGPAVFTHQGAYWIELHKKDFIDTGATDEFQNVSLH